MPRNKENEVAEETESVVGRRGHEYEDIEESRAKQRSDPRDGSDDGERELDEDDLLEIDLDAAPEGEGPDA